jgi:hypothetical protein
MKKACYVSIFLIIISLITVSGQEISSDQSNIWSVSMTFAPIETFFYYPGYRKVFKYYTLRGVTETAYPVGANLRIEHKLNTRLSICTGLNYKHKKIDNLYNSVSVFGYGYFEKSFEEKYVFAIPIQINYQILNSPKFFDPYLKTGFINSYFKRLYQGDYTLWRSDKTTNGTIDKNDSRFIMFFEFGAGTYLNLLKSLSIILETDLTYNLWGLGYYEFQGGLRYTFKY